MTEKEPNELRDGYIGKSLEFMKTNDLITWDIVDISVIDRDFTCIILPRANFSPGGCLSVKLVASGYNYGIPISKIMKITKKGHTVGSYHPPVTKVKENDDLPLVSIIGCGGTIASRLDYRTGGAIPALTPRELFAMFPELAEIARIDTNLLFNRFSENMDFDHWIKAAEKIYKEIQEGAEGIVVAHGTDTMGYAGAVFSFALQKLGIPVIVTGSQRSSDRPSSDAFQNLMDSVRVSARGNLSGVYILMHGESGDTKSFLHEGTKVRKMHSSRRDAFQSINQFPAGEVNHLTGKITIREDLPSRKKNNKDAILFTSFESDVGLFYAYPGSKGDIIDHFIDKEYKGIVIAGTGLGHVPDIMIPAIKRGINQGVHFVMTSQCLHGFVQMQVYETGRKLLRAGVIPGGSMLPETAFVKLAYTLGIDDSRENVSKMINTNIVGEMTSREMMEYYRPPDFIQKM